MPRKNWTKGLGLMMAVLLFVGNFSLPVRAAGAGGTVVINEVGWAGTLESANDEWLELYNSDAEEVDLSAWTLWDDGVKIYTFGAVKMAAKSFYLIEDSESVIPDIKADLLLNLSLANTGDKLEIKDASGALVDQINGSGGAWYAGSSTNAVSMERISVNGGDLATNFASSTSLSGKTTSGKNISGTPKANNSVSEIAAGPRVAMKMSQNQLVKDQEFVLEIEVSQIEELFAYGLNLNFDPAKVAYVRAEKGSFMSQNSLTTSFQAALDSGNSGKLILAEAITQGAQTTVSGDGTLAKITFKSLIDQDAALDFSFSGDNFLADLSGNIATSFSSYTWQAAVALPAKALIENLKAQAGTERYSIGLIWLGDADKYVVERMNSAGQYVKIAEVTEMSFLDQDAVVDAGKIIPSVDYHYRVKGVKGASEVNIY